VIAVHFVVRAPGFRTLTTQLFDAADPYCRDDAVFAVKEALMVRFRESTDGNDEVKWELDYDFYLAEE
jgi:catechol 1,2-dioxygenase